MTGVQDGDVLIYNSATEKFEPRQITASSVDWTDIQNTPNFANVATSGDYNDLLNLPTLFDGNYNSLTNQPTLFSGSFADLSNMPTTISGYGITDAFSGNYNDLINQPTLFSGSFTDLSNKPTTISGYGITDAFSGNYNDLSNLPTIPSAVSDLSDVNTSGATNGQVLSYDGTNWTPSTVSGGSSLWTQNGDDIYFSGGNIGIGTNTPNTSLEIHNLDYPGTWQGGLNYEELSIGDHNGYWRFNAGLRLVITDDGVNRVVFDENGNIGIGTDNPNKLLHIVSNTSDPTIKIQNNENYSLIGIANDPDDYLIGTQSGDFVLRAPNNKKFFLGVDNGAGNNNYGMAIIENGNIGINTKNPTSKLQVIGLTVGAFYRTGDLLKVVH